jgi:hypothetical protein
MVSVESLHKMLKFNEVVKCAEKVTITRVYKK